MKSLPNIRKSVLVLLLEVVLFVPAFFTTSPALRSTKSADQYWLETGLSDSELEKLLADENCFADQNIFLACVNAISSMAERFDLVLDLDGDLKPAKQRDVALRITEKAELSLWEKKFNQPEVSLSHGGLSFLQLWHQLEQSAVKKEERAITIATGINGFLSIFKDPHTYLIPIKMYEEVVSNPDSKAANLGFVVRRNHDHLVVRKIFETAEAAKAGLKRGDKIFALNGDPIAELSHAQVSEALKFRNMDRIYLEVDHNNHRKVIEVLRKEQIFPSVSSKMLDESRRVGLITIHRFSKDTCARAKEQIQDLKEMAMRGLVMDLRDNPGGQVEEASCVINLFVAKNQLLFETRYLDAARPADQYVSEHEPIFKGPLAVLINSGSASAAEIVAGSLKDLGRGNLVGERSFGKGSFQDGRLWGVNREVALFETSGLYYFPSGWTPQLVGLQPDIEVKADDVIAQREEDLFLKPIRPLDQWVGPQTLSWINERSCEVSPEADLISLQNFSEDPQISRAQAWLRCGQQNDRNGSL
ncbi:MAG: S41 family peptidase [Proteobacteria bacterium]|jgi:carboxyl-terminal processing protease|nr:S41 family peptidase [Pseudomonadota bacterium]